MLGNLSFMLQCATSSLKAFWNLYMLFADTLLPFTIQTAPVFTSSSYVSTSLDSMYHKNIHFVAVLWSTL
jgi:hypothetical protein